MSADPFADAVPRSYWPSAHHMAMEAWWERVRGRARYLPTKQVTDARRDANLARQLELVAAAPRPAWMSDYGRIELEVGPVEAMELDPFQAAAIQQVNDGRKPLRRADAVALMGAHHARALRSADLVARKRTIYDRPDMRFASNRLAASLGIEVTGPALVPATPTVADLEVGELVALWFPAGFARRKWMTVGLVTYRVTSRNGPLSVELEPIDERRPRATLYHRPGFAKHERDHHGNNTRDELDTMFACYGRDGRGHTTGHPVVLETAEADNEPQADPAPSALDIALQELAA